MTWAPDAVIVVEEVNLAVQAAQAVKNRVIIAEEGDMLGMETIKFHAEHAVEEVQLIAGIAPEDISNAALAAAVE